LKPELSQLTECSFPPLLPFHLGWAKPSALTSMDVYDTIEDFAKCASLAQHAGYDGVEIMGSEG